MAWSNENFYNYIRGKMILMDHKFPRKLQLNKDQIMAFRAAEICRALGTHMGITVHANPEYVAAKRDARNNGREVHGVAHQLFENAWMYDGFGCDLMLTITEPGALGAGGFSYVNDYKFQLDGNDWGFRFTMKRSEYLRNNNVRGKELYYMGKLIDKIESLEFYGDASALSNDMLLFALFERDSIIQPAPANKTW